MKLLGSLTRACFECFQYYAFELNVIGGPKGF